MNCNSNNIQTKPLQCKRDCYQPNSTVKLKAYFVDSCGNKLANDTSNNNFTVESITITKPDSTTDSIDVNTLVRVDAGFYYFEYTPTQSGGYKEEWNVTIWGEPITFTTSFSVLSPEQVSVKSIDCGLTYNSLVVLELDSNIADQNGNTLGSNEIYSFSTEYNPYYASTDMLRMEMGSWVDLVPEDTIALAIHWSSIEADNITGKRLVSERYAFARTRFVMYDAAIKLFSMPIGVSSPGSGKQKQLGDLLIENGSSLDYQIADLIEELKAERKEWWRVVNAGGDIVQGQGLGPTFATKGGSTNKYQRSREWHDPWMEHYIQPTQNSLYKKKGEKKYKHGYTGWNQHYFISIRSRSK